MKHEIPYHQPSTVKANGIEITYDAFGDPSSPGVLLIAGLGQQLIDWGNDFCRELAAPGFHVIRFDNRDSGLSSIMDLSRTTDPERSVNQAGITDMGRWLEREGITDQQKIMDSEGGIERSCEIPYSLKDMTDDAVGLLDVLGIDSAHIIGFSMGGMIAQLMAIHHPDRVRSLTCVSTTTNDPSLPSPSKEAGVMLSTPRPIDREGFITSTVELLRFSHGTAYPFDEYAARDLTERAYDRSFQPAGLARQYGAMVSQDSLRSGLEGVTSPTLVIHGDADPFIPLACGEDIAGSVLDARLVTIPGFGHMIPELYPLEVRERVIGEVGDFLEKQGGSSFD